MNTYSAAATPVDVSPKYERSETRMMGELPHVLGDLAESVLVRSKSHLFEGSGSRYTGRKHQSGDDQISVDHFANLLLRQFVQEQRREFADKWGCRLVYLSEEEDGRPFTGTPDDPRELVDGDLVVVGDPIDGSTNAKSYGEGYSTVLAAFLRVRETYVHVGGAIAAANGATVIWSGLNWVQYRLVGGADREWLRIDRAVGTASVSASVATKRTRTTNYIAGLDEDATLVHLMAGTPCIYPLLRLELGVVDEQNDQKVWDAAHLLPAIMVGCVVTTTKDECEIALDDVYGYWHEYLHNFYRLRETPIVPAFRITVPLET